MLKNLLKIILYVGCLFCCMVSFAQELKRPKAINKVIQGGIGRAYAATVQIVPFDTLSRKTVSGRFSGTVVTPQGHILTAAHAAQPGVFYQITFPNGAKYLAKGYGRISIGGFAVRNNSTSLDAAMLKIVEQGKWDFAAMGESSTMKLGELCLSIASSASFANGKPNIRLGRLTKIEYQTGFIESSCKMEPGDSGGGLFDSDGRLIGIHSFISKDEESNFEVPIDYFKKYWSALCISKDYKALPDSIDLVKVVPSTKLVAIPPVQQLFVLPKKALESAVTVKSTLGNKQTFIVGTLVSFHKLVKEKTYIISKSSMVGSNIKVMIDSVDQAATVVFRDHENDLTLLEINLPSPRNSIKIRSGTDTLGMQFADLGKLVGSGRGKGKQYISILSTNYIKIPRAKGNFGAGATFIDKKITITNITRRGSADGILKLKDVVIGINGHPISLPPHYGEEVSKYFVGDTITVELIRDGHEMQLKLCFLSFRMNHVSEQFAGGHSVKEDGFRKVLVHDGAIKAEECGGPVFDSSRQFQGINIARISRTSTLMLSYDIIRDFLEKSITSLH